MLSLPLVEGESLDYKRDWSGSQRCLQALAAFANTRGGTLILGVEDDGVTVGGFDPSDAEERRIVSSVVDLLRITPEVKRIPAPNGKRVLSLTVRKSPTLVAFQGRYLTRVGASNRDMTQDEIARRSLEVSGQTWDALPSGAPFRLDGSDPRLSPEALDAFLRLAGPRLPHASANDSQERILENLNLVRDGQPSRAALLLFGRRPQDVSSGSGIQIAQFREGRILQERVIGGPLIEQVGEALDVLRVFLGVGYEIGDRAALEGRGDLSLLERVQRAEHWPYPLPALREALVNALIHRDYTSSDRTQIRVDEDALAFWNPGGLPAGLSLQDLTRPGHPSRRRNPHLADAFHLAGLVERWGTGTTRMIDAMQHAGLPAPTFAEDGGGFRVTFTRELFPPELLARLNERQQRALTYLRQHPTITNAQYRELTGAPDRTASLDLKSLLELGVLIREGKGRNVAYRLNRPEIPQ